MPGQICETSDHASSARGPEQVAPAAAPSEPAAQPEVQPAPNAAQPAEVPTFDTVRVEKTGEAVIAGTAEQGAEVVVKLDGSEIGKTTANNDGSFVVIPEKVPGSGSRPRTPSSRVCD